MFLWIVVIFPALSKADTTIEDSSPCETGWTYFGNEYCYKFRKVRTYWKDASAKCSRMGGHLASIHSKEQNGKLEEFGKKSGIDYWWTGLHDNDLDSKYVWDDGTDVDYLRWRYNEPDGNYTLGGDCAAITVKGVFPGKWYLLPCRLALAYLCQKKIKTAITSTELDISSVAPSVLTSTEIDKISFPVLITTRKENVGSDYLISVTTYIIIVAVVIVLVTLIGGMLYYKRFWIKENRLKASAVFFRKNYPVNDGSTECIIEHKETI